MHIDLAPLINAYVVPILTAVLLSLASWAMSKAATYFHFTVQDGQRALVNGAIDNAIAYAQQMLAGKENVTANQTVSTAVNYLLPKIPDTLKALGVTPEHLAQIITAKLPA